MAGPDFQTRYLQILAASPYVQGILKPGRAVADLQYYAYNGRVGSDAVPLAPGVPQTFTFDTQADSDFVVAAISASVQETVGGPMAYNDNVALQIQDLSTGKRFFNIPTVIGLVTGAGGFPFELPAPRVFAPNTAIAVSATNRDVIVNGGAGPVGLFFAFHGFRVFYA